MKYLTESKILYKYQFRKDHFADTCLLYLTDGILTGLNFAHLTGMVDLILKKGI